MSEIADRIRKRVDEYSKTADGYALTLKLDLGLMLMQAEEAQGLSVSQVKQRTGLAEHRISNLHHADTNVSLDEIGRICHSLGIKPRLRCDDV